MAIGCPVSDEYSACWVPIRHQIVSHVMSTLAYCHSNSSDTIISDSVSLSDLNWDEPLLFQ